MKLINEVLIGIIWSCMVIAIFVGISFWAGVGLYHGMKYGMEISPLEINTTAITIHE